MKSFNTVTPSNESMKLAERGEGRKRLGFGTNVITSLLCFDLIWGFKDSRGKSGLKVFIHISYD